MKRSHLMYRICASAAAVFLVSGLISPVSLKAETTVEASQEQLNKGSLGFFESRGSADAVRLINDSITAGDTKLGEENDATSLVSMLDALSYIDECNNLRRENGLDALKVNDYCMAAAQAHLNWSDTSMQHKGTDNVGENLSWGYSDPFVGWYQMERQLYNSGNTAAAGHYLNIINANYKVTGFAVDNDPASMYGVAHGQTFGYEDTGAETVAQYRTDLINYINQAGAFGIDMYRMYNPYSGEHLYTADVTEKNRLTGIGWVYEGIGWTAPGFSTNPVYRMYNPYNSDHHYTMDYSEVMTMVRNGWRYEGIGWYSDVNKTVPLYREFNPYANVGSHNYTTSKSENDHLVEIGWAAEGTAWYGLKASQIEQEEVKPAPQESAASEDSDNSNWDGTYIANANPANEIKKFHKSNCPSVKNMKESNKVEYDSREQAVADGYVPCEICNP